MNKLNHHNKRILLVDPDEAFGQALRTVLGEGYTLTHVKEISEAISILGTAEIDVTLFNWDQQSRSGASGDPHELLKDFTDGDSAPPVIVFSFDTRRETAMEAMRQGALDFFIQPLSVMELKFAIARACQRTALLRELTTARKVVAASAVDGLIGNSKVMERIRDVIGKVAGVSTTVLVTGESGTGKEVVARGIHRLSQRANQPFVAFSATAFPESLIEDELFGHNKGAFTGASQNRRGRFEEAQGGTVFLDEIGDLAPPLQAKLLRVLQERAMERLGSNAPVPLDVRVICATNRNLEAMIREGTFRSDLYFRISVVKIPLPPLRQRAEDIPLLAEHFMRMFASVHDKDIRGYSAAFLSALITHDWPGNVRELQNVIERSVVLADGPQLGLIDLPQDLRGLAIAAEVQHGSFHAAVKSFKREIVRSALRVQNGNRLKAARELRISRCYLHRLMNQLEICERQPEGLEEPEMSDQEPPSSPREEVRKLG